MATLVFNQSKDWAVDKLQPHTTSVAFHADFSIQDTHISEVASRCPNLTHFTAGNQDTGVGSSCSPAAVLDLASTCSKLRHLHLWSFCLIDDDTAIEVAKKLPDLEEFTNTGHDRSAGNIKGKLLRALAGWDDSAEQQLKASEADFKERIKDAMRDVINRGRARKGLPPLKKGEVPPRPSAGSDEDENDDEEYYGLSGDPERTMLENESDDYFEIHDDGGDVSTAAFYDEEDGVKPGSFVMLDYYNDQVVVVEMNDPKPQPSGPFIAPRLKKLFLEDQSINHNDIQKLKKARRGVKVFKGESCGSGYAAQMVYQMSGGMPGEWY